MSFLGGVAVGTMGSMMLGPGGAMAIGAAAAVLSVIGYKYITVKSHFVLIVSHSSFDSIRFCFQSVLA